MNKFKCPYSPVGCSTNLLALAASEGPKMPQPPKVDLFDGDGALFGAFFISDKVLFLMRKSNN